MKKMKTMWDISQIPPEKIQDDLLLMISDHEAHITYTIRLGDLKKYILGESNDISETRKEMEKKSPEILEQFFEEKISKVFSKALKKLKKKSS